MKMKARAVVGKGEKGLRLVTLDLTVRLGREKEKQNVAKVIDGMMSTQTKKKRHRFYSLRGEVGRGDNMSLKTENTYKLLPHLRGGMCSANGRTLATATRPGRDGGGGREYTKRFVHQRSCCSPRGEVGAGRKSVLENRKHTSCCHIISEGGGLKNVF